MNFYRFQGKTLFSVTPWEHPQAQPISEGMAKDTAGPLFLIKEQDPLISRAKYAITDADQIFLQEEGLHLLTLPATPQVPIAPWLQEKIAQGMVTAINPAFPRWEQRLNQDMLRSWRIHIAGLGDVGGTLLMGLRLLGGDLVESIGIYDHDQDKLKRWEMEANQIYALGTGNYPPVKILSEEEIFDCDLFAFTVAARVPALGEEQQDVRMVQLERNAKIVNSYGQMARKAGFQGIFAVISDPVDLLCKSVLLSSNQNEQGQWDGLGLTPDQIRGYGLGVMHARARYYALQSPETQNYEVEGRAFGPHGADLVIANSIVNYDESLSLYLTEKAATANLEVRKTGYKPFIAPALSSAALSLLSTLRGDWHHSATYLGGVYMGARNRLTPGGTVLERLPIPPQLMARLENTYRRLGELL